MSPKKTIRKVLRRFRKQRIFSKYPYYQISTGKTIQLPANKYFLSHKKQSNG